MENLDQISDKALELAATTRDPDGMLKAIQASAAASDLVEKQVESRRYRQVRRLASLLTPYTAVLAIILSVFTLASQSCQFRRVSEQQESSAEQSQWRDALKSVSSKDESAVLSATLQMQSFFDSRRYGTSARTVAVTLLPDVGSEAAFDAVYYDLRTRTTKKNEKDLITVAQVVTFNDWELCNEAVQEMNCQAKFVDFVIDPRGFLSQHKVVSTSQGGDTGTQLVKRALRYSWEIDTVGRQLSALWKDQSTNPGPAQMDLSGLILGEFDFENVDFSGSPHSPTQLRLVSFYNADLIGANFENTELSQASFIGITKFSGSKWTNANWWKAQGLSCQLGHYLEANYPVPSNATSDQKANSQSLVKTACNQETAAKQTSN